MTSAPIVVVTGANRGIGFEISRQLAIYPIYQNRHFLFGFVDVDNDGCAALFSSGIGFRLCTSRLRSAFHGRRIGLSARGSSVRASFWGWIGVGRATRYFGMCRGDGGTGSVQVRAGLRDRRKREHRRQNRDN